MEYKKLSTIPNPLIWPQLLHFNYGERWGDPDKMDVRLLWELDRVRHDLARRVIVHCGFEYLGHAKKSFHKIGMAVDFHVENMRRGELYDLYKYFLLVWHGGVGVYPFWDKPGFHLDIGPDRTWVKDAAGIYHSDSARIDELVIV